MEARDTKGKIVKETFPAEIISIVGDISAGVVLSLLILPFDSFFILILIVPALLSMRGNISGPFIARSSRDLIIGQFSKKSWIENVLATYLLSMVTGFIIGLFSFLLDLTLVKLFLIRFDLLITIPILSIIFALTISIPCSTILNYIAFKYGLDPNNVVNPIMTAIDDFSTVICFYLTIILLGVP
ncbi:MAG: magnesium transporter [Candidatus Hermodarchaeota archaeon]